MKVSIIVPIYNADKYLDDFFKNIEKNKFQKGDEIILTDNGSKDRTKELCLKKVKEKPDLYKYLDYSIKPGSYAARNYAVDNSHGDILIFTDSDTKPSKDWVSIIRSKITKGTIIAGRIKLEVLSDNLWELYDSLVHLNSEQNAKNSSVATANMAVYKEDFKKIGYFEERFSGGDYEWSNRACKNGMKINFVSEAYVLHPTRKTFEEILKKEQRIAYGKGNHQKINNKSFFSLILIYILKIFKIDTNIRCSINLVKMGLKPSKLFEFNLKFFSIRLEQLKFAIKGYKMADARKLDLK